MKVRSFVVLVVLAPFAFVLTAAQPATAGDPEMSLKEKQRWAEMSKLIEERAEAASQACGVKITAAFDVPSFKGTDLFKESPTARCRDVVNTITSLCSTDIGKESVQKGVGTITCKKSTDGTRVAREKRALTVFIDAKSPAIVGKQKGVYSWKTAIEEIL